MSGAATAEVLVEATSLDARVEALARELDRDYRGRSVLLIGILKGSTLFLADLLRHLSLDASVDFMSISSYAQGGAHTGVVRIMKDLEVDIGGRHVLIVEDIVDTGLTLNYLRRALAERNPKTLRTVTLLDKTARRIIPVPVEYRGFEIEDVFVIGYGLDWQGRYRNLPDLRAVDDVSQLASDPPALEHRPDADRRQGGVSFGR